MLMVLAIVGIGGWYVWDRNGEKDIAKKPDNKTSQVNKESNGGNEEPSDHSEGGKYLVIEEWGVRVAIPPSLQGKTLYSLGEVISDPDGNQIQAAKLLIKNDPAAGNECTATERAEGAFIDTAAQLLRVEKAKAFDTERYKGTFEAYVLEDDEHAYHLNYITPDCAGITTTNQIEELQSALEGLQEIK